MIVQSPLRKREARPNLRRVPKPNVESPTPSHTNKRTATKVKSSSVKSRIQGIKPWKVILASVIVGLFGFMYLTHVFATQSLLEEVQILEVEFNKARSKHDALKLQYDKMVGPADIYRNAEKAGFVNGGPADKVITIKD